VFSFDRCPEAARASGEKGRELRIAPKCRLTEPEKVGGTGSAEANP
jgi:hypothetical protein